ncbi:MAG: hypothetical protein ACLFVP_06375 [Candidatus Bathyarchaeia archaeon]
MDTGKLKLVIGLAFENAIVFNRYIEELEDLYQNPNQEDLLELYERLIGLEDHISRTIAIWLELAIEQEPLRTDPQRLAVEMREMEYVLYNLLQNSRKTKRELNDWMNFIANASHFV